MTKAYIVTEYGGQYEDAWHHVIGVCSTLELAEQIRAQIKEPHDPSNCAISRDDWESMTVRLWDAEDEGYEYDDDISAIKELFPQYSIEDIKKAQQLYDDDSDWCGVMIQEVNFYNSLSDFNNGNNFGRIIVW